RMSELRRDGARRQRVRLQGEPPELLGQAVHHRYMAAEDVGELQDVGWRGLHERGERQRERAGSRTGSGRVDGRRDGDGRGMERRQSNRGEDARLLRAGADRSSRSLVLDGCRPVGSEQRVWLEVSACSLSKGQRVVAHVGGVVLPNYSGGEL